MPTVVVTAERIAGERRVAATPETVGMMVAAGLDVIVESAAGAAAGFSDAAFLAAGATVDPVAPLGSADVLLHVRPVAPAVAALLKPGAVTIGLANPGAALASVAALRDAGTTSFALELIPRISRAQSMDALTSQSLVAGYRCALEAATRLPRFFPLFMTAAGTVPPATVVVLGAGVAGLQAIATAKRLGARVSAYDVRPSSAEEVRSMGGTFLELGLDSVEGAGGYARELTEDRAALQREQLAPFIAKADVLITTAALPGRRAPRLVSVEMVARMRTGSVVVDLAAETGGNVEGSIAGEVVDVPSDDGAGSVTVLGMRDPASAMPADASRLYAKNVANLLMLMTHDGALASDFTDEVIAQSCFTHAGKVRHQPTADALAAGTGERS
ncbi:MAG: alanine dehydrogenase/PNT domain protein [Microbacteriaceae bacterium]|nr:alanine dehydrogenase/PNT domain protein [Microbacteriaceae bacterium]HEV7955867.1 NAD(P) transhydrogenase subunit alpha [Marisediminicola sp.]